MDTQNPLLRWREVVHPLFWPVFFWNLRRFARFMRLSIETGGNGLIAYELTWWGQIRIHRVINPDAPRWDADLVDCASRIHSLTLDVSDPYLSKSDAVSGLGDRRAVRTAALSRLKSSSHARNVCTRAQGGTGRLSLGAFAEPAHLNTR